jgi:hypothetical protein
MISTVTLRMASSGVSVLCLRELMGGFLPLRATASVAMISGWTVS